MKKLKLQLENCYGIKLLQHEFDFVDSRANFIYAPNGIMKTSFATTFKDISEDKDSQDRVYPELTTVREVLDENGKPITKEMVFVIEPYQENYKSDRISTLLVNKVLKDKYDRIYSEINSKKNDLVKALKTHSGLRSGIEEEIADSFVHDKKEFFRALERIKSDISSYKPTPLDDVIYQNIYNDKVANILESTEFKKEIANYIETYDKLLSGSNFFKKGVFNHNNAADTAKSLKDNGFFKADHSVYISSLGKRIEIKTETELENVIKQEKDSILNNSALAKSFEALDKILTKNKDTRDFRAYIEANKVVIPELNNLNKLRQKLWISYLAKEKSLYDVLIQSYEKGRLEIEGIVKQASAEATEWQGVIAEFNDRFSVPFEVRMENQEDVILKEEAPNISFHFKEDASASGVPISEDDLIKVLSNGEKKALYILNIIFEVRARKAANQETLFIVDDIADSFDYKNKYAIIEYLRDISREPNFTQLILTHNFDFFRTVTSRIGCERKHRWHTVKTSSGITLVQEFYQKNPFSHWKDNLNNKQMMIAAIPFVRNLAEYCGYSTHYSKLTSLLHIMDDTDSIKVSDLQAVFVDVLKDKVGLALSNPTSGVKDIIYAEADTIYSEVDEIVELEQKIVLSIAIRLRAEEFMIQEISDSAFMADIKGKGNQTAKLVTKYKLAKPGQVDKIRVLDQVKVMTPDNIHINSFMYEPILDMAIGHLKSLYSKVKSL